MNGRDLIPRVDEDLAAGMRFKITTYPDNLYEIVSISLHGDSIWEPTTVYYKQVMPNGMLAATPPMKSTTFLGNSRVRLI